MPGDSALEAMLIKHEGEVLHAYPDSEGYLTIGVGHLIDSRRGGGISKRISRLLLQEDIERVKRDVHANLPFVSGLNEVRRNVVYSMAFNLGINGLLKFERMLAALRAWDYVNAAREMLDSKWAHQVGNRADELARMMADGKTAA